MYRVGIEAKRRQRKSRTETHPETPWALCAQGFASTFQLFVYSVGVA